MNKPYKIPSIYQKMQENGYTSRENYLWLNEMRWMPIDEIFGYQHDEGENKSILPFAITGGGDKWVWIVDEENEEYKVGLCERGEFNGFYYAKNTEDAIIRQIIEFVLAAEDVCIPAHGLYCIAKSWLTAEEFAKLTMPKHKAFLQDYAQWRLENPTPMLKPYMVYPKDMDIFNRIYAMPTAKTYLTQERFTENSKLQPVIDCRKMHGIFVDALRSGEEGEQH